MQHTQVEYIGHITVTDVRDYLRDISATALTSLKDIIDDFRQYLFTSTSIELNFTPNYELVDAHNQITREFASHLDRMGLLGAFILWINGLPIPKEFGESYTWIRRKQWYQGKQTSELRLIWSPFDFRHMIAAVLSEKTTGEQRKGILSLLESIGIPLDKLPGVDLEAFPHEPLRAVYWLYDLLCLQPGDLKYRYTKISEILNWAAIAKMELA